MDELSVGSAADGVEDSYRQLLKRRSERGAVAKKKLDADDAMQLPTAELDQLEILFKECDTNGDGVVDFSEFKQVMELLAEKKGGKHYNFLQVRGLFRMADLDNSGYIDFYEFLHAQRRMKRNWGQAKAALFVTMALNANKEKAKAEAST